MGLVKQKEFSSRDGPVADKPVKIMANGISRRDAGTRMADPIEYRGNPLDIRVSTYAPFTAKQS